MRTVWSGAGVVLVGADRAAELAALALPRRAGVVVVVPDEIGPDAWRNAVAVGAEAVLSVADDGDRIVDLLESNLGDPASGVLLGVLGACGGAGASVFAAALAAAGCAAGVASLLVDADPWGGGADVLLGGEDVSGLRWADLAGTTGRVSAASLRDVLPVVDGVTVLSWSRKPSAPLPAAAMRSVLTAARRGFGLVVVDLPRRDDDAALAALAMAQRVVWVLPDQLRAVAAAHTRVQWLRRASTDVAVLVREVDGRAFDPDAAADSLGLPLLASMRSERGLASWLDEGFGPRRRSRGPLARACSVTLDACGVGVPGGTA